MKNQNSMPAMPEVGANVKKERRSLQWSLETLALRSGVSKAMLSQIEAGKTNPTVGTLWKIAQALEVEFDALIKGEGGRLRRFEINRGNCVTSVSTDKSDTVFKVLSPLSSVGTLEFYLVEQEVGGAHFSQPHGTGTEEFVTVLEGRIEVRAGNQQAELSAGDFIIYQSDVEHSITNIGPVPVKLHMTVRFNNRDTHTL